MELKIKFTINSEPIYLYIHPILLSSFKKNSQNKVLKVIDEVVKLFSKKGDFVDCYYIWDRSTPLELSLIRRSERKLSTDEEKLLEKKFNLFATTIQSILEKIIH